ncbi:YnfA family protein [Methanobacterium sp. ACI-7]|uniref:YnfA family protein n=1 Tax=unclassified Methanobacterium TaxID=2627676 RepID=UPI0039C3807D
MQVVESIIFFIIAGLCEIGGDTLYGFGFVKVLNIWFGVFEAIILFLYGIIPTLQPANFGRVYAAYGGIFIVMSLLWGWQVDKITPDKFDIVGGLISLIGVSIIMYWPRS